MPASTSSSSSSGSSSGGLERVQYSADRAHRDNLRNADESIGGGGGAGAGNKRSAMKPNSAYVSHNRFSRYLAALSSLALVRFKSALGSELPLDKIGLFSNASFRWLNEYLYAGYKNGMKEKTLPSLSHRETCDDNGPRLESLLHTHFVEKGQAGASIPQVAWRFVRTRVVIGSVIYFVGNLISLAGPIFVLRGIVRATEERNAINSALAQANRTVTINETGVSDNFGQVFKSKQNEIVMDEIIIFSHTGLLIFIEFASQFLVSWSSSLNLRTACRLRSACLAVSYKKLLRSSLRCSTTAQQTLTYFVPDSEVLHELIGLGPVVVTGPTVLLLVLGFTWFALGNYALFGILLIVLFYACLVTAAYFTKAFAARAIEYSLRRMSLVEEFVSNIQMAKVTLWDQHFQSRIKDIRARELAEMQFGGFSEGCGLSMIHMIPVFTVSFITLVSLLFEKQISFVEYVPVLVLFLVNLKHCVRTSWMALSSISRGLAFLNKLKSILILQEAERFLDKPIDRNFAIIIHNGHFTWSKGKPLASKVAKRSSRFYVDGQNGGKSGSIELNFPSSCATTLTEIDFYVPKGKLVGLYGRQDSGKSSFLLSILGQLQCVGGTVAIDGSCSYVPSRPWLMDGTLKENVLFGEAFDSSRYYRTLRASQLNQDIATMPEMDDTDVQVAELAPAQRQRIGLARAAYAQRDINLMDEPLRDLEYRDRLDVFDKCVLQLMASKTVILASDRTELLSRCQVVYVMQEGRIVESGTHEELLQSNGQYAKLAETQARSRHKKFSKSGELHSSSPSAAHTPSTPKDFLSSLTVSSYDSTHNSNEDAHPLYGKSRFDYPVLRSFSEGRPKTGLRVYLKYTGGWSIGVLLCVLSALYACSIALAPVCIVHVGQKSIQDIKVSIGVLATLVGFLIVCGVILTIAYSKTIFVAATRLHDYWIESLGSAQISIFNSATISMLLNICSLNLQEVDSVLPRSIITIMINLGVSFFSLVVLSLLSPWLLLPVLAFVVVSMIFSVYVRGAVLNLHELKVNSATLVLNHIGSTVQGRATIQAFSKEKDFAKKYYRLFNENSTYDFMLYATRLWLEFRMKLLSVLVLSAVIFVSELLYSGVSSLPQLSLAYICTMQITLSVLHTIGAVNSVYTSLMALNSVDHYMKTVPKEREGSARLSSMWPTDGSLEFRNVLLFDREESMRKPLTFALNSGDNLAVISMQAEARAAFVSSLFRFAELPAGEIFIGGTSISQAPLHMLRRCICFVPGNPMLFNGTIRHNLDPSAVIADQSLMRVLQKVQLWEKVSKLPDKLVSDAGNLFTIYEKFLIFLARALLNEHTKIIILEDPEVDVLDDRSNILEVVLRSVFADYTVIRLSSHRIRSCQKFLTLDDEVEDYNSDQGSSTLSQVTMTTELYTAVPAHITLSSDGINSETM